MKQKYNDNEEGTRGINEGLSKSENPSVPKNVKKKRAFPTNCTVCGHIASGYVFYNAMCCDGKLINYTREIYYNLHICS